MSKKNKPYLPKVRTDYHPTKSKCDNYTEIGHPEDMPNPAHDPIVVNNIASQEFDYTQDMLTSEEYSLNSKDVKKY